MYCIECGKQIVDGALFCQYCGARVSAGAAQGHESGAAQAGAQEPDGGAQGQQHGAPVQQAMRGGEPQQPVPYAQPAPYVSQPDAPAPYAQPAPYAATAPQPNAPASYTQPAQPASQPDVAAPYYAPPAPQPATYVSQHEPYAATAPQPGATGEPQQFSASSVPGATGVPDAPAPSAPYAQPDASAPAYTQPAQYAPTPDAPAPSAPYAQPAPYAATAPQPDAPAPYAQPAPQPAPYAPPPDASAQYTQPVPYAATAPQPDASAPYAQPAPQPAPYAPAPDAPAPYAPYAPQPAPLAPAKPKKKSLKIAIIAAAAVLVFGGGFAAAWFGGALDGVFGRSPSVSDSDAGIGGGLADAEAGAAGAPAERLSNADSAKKVMEDGAVALSGVLLDSVSEIPFGGEWFETSVGLSVSAPDAYIQEFLSVMGAPLDLQDEAMRGQFEIVRLLANSELALSVIAGLNANAGAGADAGASALAPEFGASAAWSVRGQKMLSLESFFADGEMLLKIPELSEMVLKVPADLEYALDALNDSMSPAMLGKMSEYAEQASPIIERLLGIALSHIDYAEAGSETLSLGGSPVVLDTVELTITQRSLFEAGLAMLRDIRGDDAAVALVAGFYNDVLAPNYEAPILPADVASGLDELIAQLDATAQLDAAAQIAQAGGAPGEAGSSLPGGGDAADDGEAAGADSADGAEPGEYYGEYAAGAGLGGAFDIGKLKIYLKDGAFAGFSAAGGAMLAAGGEFGFAADPALGYSSWVKSSDKSVELVELHGSLATGPDGLDGDMHLRMVDAESGEAFEMKLLDFSGLAQALPAGSSAGAGSAGAGGERHFRLSMAVSDLLDAFAGKEDSAISWVSDGAYALAEPSAEFFRGAVFSIDIPYGGQQPGSAVEFRAEDAARGASVALSFGARPSPSGAPARPEGEALDADALSYDESLQQELRDDLMDGANAVIDKAVGQGYDIEPIRQAIVYGISSASFGMPSAGAPAPDYGYGYGDGDSYDYDYGDDGGDGSGYGEGGGHAYGEGLSGFDESELRDFVDTMVYSGEFSALYETVDRLAGEGELTEDFVGWYYSLEQIQRRVIIATINFEFGESAAMEQAMLDDAFGAGQFGDAGGYDAASAWLADAQQAVSADEPDFFWDAYMALAEAGAL